MIKKIIKYGSAVAAGIAIGAQLWCPGPSEEPHDVVTTDQEVDVWKGETNELVMSVDFAEQLSEALSVTIDEDAVPDAIQAGADIRNIRTRLDHNIAHAYDEGWEKIKIELTDRERLRLMESSLLARDNNPFVPEDYFKDELSD